MRLNKTWASAWNENLETFVSRMNGSHFESLERITTGNVEESKIIFLGFTKSLNVNSHKSGVRYSSRWLEVSKKKAFFPTTCNCPFPDLLWTVDLDWPWSIKAHFTKKKYRGVRYKVQAVLTYCTLFSIMLDNIFLYLRYKIYKLFLLQKIERKKFKSIFTFGNFLINEIIAIKPFCQKR